MTRELQLQLSPRDAASELTRALKISSALDIDINRIKKVDILRKSIDARQRDIKINLSLRVHLDEIEDTRSLNSYIGYEYKPVADDAPQVVIVGAGPAGLFAALELIECGVKPIVLERGKDVDSRRKDLSMISREGIVNPDSNYCFGEGGAGTFSDGKLYTRSKKKGDNSKVLAILHGHGAPENILYDAHPHIGTDRLPDIIKNIRNTIIRCGGEVHFNTKVTELLIEGAGSPDSSAGTTQLEVTGVKTAGGEIYKGPVILATGHSARDTYRMLLEKGVAMEPKGLAVGVRLEHPQELIDRLQYHSPSGRGKYLPPAEYSFLTRVDGRGVYSFCMCPGGTIVPSASAPGQSAVNGMSSSSRGSRWANSGMVVEILPEDIEGEDPLKMLLFQEKIEGDFFNAASHTQKAPAQRMTDFVNSRESQSLESSSYAAGLVSRRVDLLLPPMISKRLQKGFEDFNKKKKGFLTPKATVVGAETRTSSPVRLPRDAESRNHVEIKNLYPVGEGAGWAGGIVSSAVDGQNSARILAQTLRK